MDILAMLILPVCEHRISFHLFVTSSVFFSSKSHSFHCTDVSLPWLNLFLNVLLFWCHCKWGSFFFFSFQIFCYWYYIHVGLPRWLSGKESACQCRRCRFDSWVERIPWRMKWQPTPVFLAENSMDRGAWQATIHGVTESDMTEHACMQI